MGIHRHLFAAALFCAALGTTARGDAISYSAAFGRYTPNYDQSVTLDRFHGNLADLVSVSVMLSVTVSGGALCIDNDAPLPASVTVNRGAAASISSSEVTLLDTLLQPVTGTVSASSGASFLLGEDNGDGPLNPDCTAPDGAIHLGGLAGDAKTGVINTLFHPQYVGAGSFRVDISALQILDLGSVGGVEGSFTPVLAEGSVMVTYDYVPEPGTAALLGMGPVALLLRRWRKILLFAR